MPEAKTLQRARRARRQGKSPSTQAGEFVREEIHHIREGKHGARSTKQAIAIGLSKARRAGVDLPVPKKGESSEKTRAQAKRDTATGRSARRQTRSEKRSSAAKRALRRESGRAASSEKLAQQARQAARRRSAGERSASAKKAAGTRRRNRE